MASVEPYMTKLISDSQYIPGAEDGTYPQSASPQPTEGVDESMQQKVQETDKKQEAEEGEGDIRAEETMEGQMQMQPSPENSEVEQQSEGTSNADAFPPPPPMEPSPQNTTAEKQSVVFTTSDAEPSPPQMQPYPDQRSAGGMTNSDASPPPPQSPQYTVASLSSDSLSVGTARSKSVQFFLDEAPFFSAARDTEQMLQGAGGGGGGGEATVTTGENVAGAMTLASLGAEDLEGGVGKEEIAEESAASIKKPPQKRDMEEVASEPVPAPPSTTEEETVEERPARKGSRAPRIGRRQPCNREELEPVVFGEGKMRPSRQPREGWMRNVLAVQPQQMPTRRGQRMVQQKPPPPSQRSVAVRAGQDQGQQQQQVSGDGGRSPFHVHFCTKPECDINIVKVSITDGQLSFLPNDDRKQEGDNTDINTNTNTNANRNTQAPAIRNTQARANRNTQARTNRNTQAPNASMRTRIVGHR